jgi:hypothetical protein
MRGCGEEGARTGHWTKFVEELAGLLDAKAMIWPRNMTWRKTVGGWTCLSARSIQELGLLESVSVRQWIHINWGSCLKPNWKRNNQKIYSYLAIPLQSSAFFHRQLVCRRESLSTYLVPLFKVWASPQVQVIGLRRIQTIAIVTRSSFFVRLSSASRLLLCSQLMQLSSKPIQISLSNFRIRRSSSSLPCTPFIQHIFLSSLSDLSSLVSCIH